MNDEPLAQIERELLRWDGVFKKRDEDGPGGLGVTGYRYGDPEAGDLRSDTSTTTATPTSGSPERSGTS